MKQRITEIAGKEMTFSKDFSVEKVAFYRGIGFQPPYRLLLDGSVVKDFRQPSDFEEFATVASRILKAGVQIYILRCSVDSPTLSWAAKNKKLCTVAVCVHQGDKIEGEECIRQLIGEDNSFKFFIVTNERRVCHQYANMMIVFGVPIMFHSSKGLCLMPPRREVREFIEGQQGEDDQIATRKRKKNKLKKIRRLEAEKKEGGANILHKQRKKLNRARKRQRELEEQQQQEEEAGGLLA